MYQDAETESVDLKQLNKKVDQIIQLLTGNPLNKADKGMLGKLDWAVTTVRKLDKQKERALGWIAGAFIVGSGCGTVIFFVLNYLKSK